MKQRIVLLSLGVLSSTLLVAQEKPELRKRNNNKPQSQQMTKSGNANQGKKAVGQEIPLDQSEEKPAYSISQELKDLDAELRAHKASGVKLSKPEAMAILQKLQSAQQKGSTQDKKFLYQTLKELNVSKQSMDAVFSDAIFLRTAETDKQQDFAAEDLSNSISNFPPNETIAPTVEATAADAPVASQANQSTEDTVTDIPAPVTMPSEVVPAVATITNVTISQEALEAANPAVVEQARAVIQMMLEGEIYAQQQVSAEKAKATVQEIESGSLTYEEIERAIGHLDQQYILKTEADKQQVAEVPALKSPEVPTKKWWNGALELITRPLANVVRGNRFNTLHELEKKSFNAQSPYAQDWLKWAVDDCEKNKDMATLVAILDKAELIRFAIVPATIKSAYVILKTRQAELETELFTALQNIVNAHNAKMKELLPENKPVDRVLLKNSLRESEDTFAKAWDQGYLDITTCKRDRSQLYTKYLSSDNDAGYESDKKSSNYHPEYLLARIKFTGQKMSFDQDVSTRYAYIKQIEDGVNGLVQITK